MCLDDAWNFKSHTGMTRQLAYRPSWHAENSTAQKYEKSSMGFGGGLINQL